MVAQRKTWTLHEISVKRAEDREAEKNSLSWILPIARECLRHFHSDELEELIQHMVAKRQMREMRDSEKRMLTVSNDD